MFHLILHLAPAVQLMPDRFSTETACDNFLHDPRWPGFATKNGDFSSCERTNIEVENRHVHPFSIIETGKYQPRPARTSSRSLKTSAAKAAVFATSILL